MGEVPPEGIKALALSELLDEEHCRAYVQWFMGHIGSPNSSVASSMLAKRVAYLLAAPVLSAMTYCNKGIRVGPEHCYLFHLKAPPAPTAFPFMTLSSVQVTTPEAQNRETWRAGVVQQLFADCLTPIMKNLAAVGSVSMATLWENVTVRIAPVYSDDEELDEEVRQRIREDFFFIAMDASGEQFGTRKNPITAFTEKDNNCGIMGRSKRRTCCLYYQMAPEYCLKCSKV
ncbi:hypothetical protein BK142_10680 [Paenibacillus glucanolyticus]|nr:hypothetical protein BK142_10680 [Paenibacillus glucanolyticus]